VFVIFNNRLGFLYIVNDTVKHGGYDR